jgi:hypothetical protein
MGFMGSRDYGQRSFREFSFVVLEGFGSVWHCFDVTVPKRFITRTYWPCILVLILVYKACCDEADVYIVNLFCPGRI